MRVAIPVDDAQFCPHFGRSSAVLLCEVDLKQRTIERRRLLDRPAHGCDSYPRWLADLAVDVVVAAGMGAGARQGLADRHIATSLGHTGRTLDDVLASFLDHPQGRDDGACDHRDHEHHHCRH